MFVRAEGGKGKPTIYYDEKGPAFMVSGPRNRKYKSFVVILNLTFILFFFLPIQGFCQEQGYEPEKIVTLLHTIPYKYCKDKPDKNPLDNHIFNVIMYKYKFENFILGLGWNKDYEKDKRIEESLIQQGLLLEGEPNGFNPTSFIVFKDYKIGNIQELNNNIKVVNVIYNRIGFF